MNDLQTADLLLICSLVRGCVLGKSGGEIFINMAEYKGKAHEGDRAARILKNMEKRKEEMEAQKEKIRKVR